MNVFYPQQKIKINIRKEFFIPWKRTTKRTLNPQGFK